MELDLHTKQQLAGLLAKPETVTQANAGLLAKLVKAYPYYQPLHLLLAKANAEEENNQNTLTTAALYNQGSILHQVIFEPKKLAPIEDLTIVVYTDESATKTKTVQQEEVSVNDEQEVFEEIAELKADPIAEEKPAVADSEEETFEEITEVAATVTEETQAEPTIDKEITEEEIVEINPVTVEEPVYVETYNFREENEHQTPEQPADIEEKPAPEEETEEQVFDEINELDTSTLPTAQEEAVITPIAEEEENLSDLPLENIVSSDSFAFEKSNGDKELTKDEPEVHAPKPFEPEEYNQEAEAQSTVSKYDDDKLPFTFLWWLAKTRKDHEQIFQPYVTPKKHKNPTALQQQYVEHIFHLQTPFSAAEETAKGPLNNQVAKKGDEIIDSFIKNDPQIRALKPDQINNENKAKKSAEDHNDLVSETLATIYIEQMLYHKAIETYEKLSLKFPEKSRYFADLIQSLEKKI